MSFKPCFYFKGEFLPDGKTLRPCLNGEAYATHDEALKSARARFMVWTAPADCGVVESEEPVVCRWNAELCKADWLRDEAA